MTSPLGIWSDARMGLHDMGVHHPERPDRLRVSEAALRALALPDVQWSTPTPCPIERLERVHSQAYIARVLATAAQPLTCFDADTLANAHTAEAALLASGAVCDATDAVLTGERQRALALVRPPGHHATADTAMGFCFFNHIACAARHAQHAHGVERVLILDWDVHHGNGTESIFYEDPSVMLIDSHQRALFPGTGPEKAIGWGAGEGFTVNVPLSAGSGDEVMARLVEEVWTPHAERFRPDLILVSAGFDAHELDPLANLTVTEAGFAALATAARELADRLCQGRLVLTLEGGYHLDALARSLCAVVGALI